ncbi:hypothetical protein RF11_07575 [Thelohanellus kitauei]|uniref:Tc1-like transposase DDE domain-containing protein n=1 Tax=Thelohanellus kitauei TaxID=669202 RepID=A0A0C2MDA9_THEKT|nr:hypothetical protein RF11_07575 [Thelohanellus kitauei]
MEKSQADSQKIDPEIKAERRECYSHIVYVYESPFNLHIFKSHGWSYVGTTPNPIVPNSRGQNVTMLLAISCYSIIQYDAIVGRVAVLREGDFTIVMDNARSHHSAVNNMDTSLIMSNFYRDTHKQGPPLNRIQIDDILKLNKTSWLNLMYEKDRLVVLGYEGRPR